MNLINRRGVDNLVLGAIIKDCRELPSSEEGFCLKHVYREANRFADSLANIALESPLGERPLQLPPHGLEPLLLSDTWVSDLHVLSLCNEPRLSLFPKKKSGSLFFIEVMMSPILIISLAPEQPI